MRLIPILATGLLLGGCLRAPHDEQAAENARTAEQKIAAERTERELAETRLREQEARASRWQFAGLLAASTAGVALIIGTILGSRARHDSAD